MKTKLKDLGIGYVLGKRTLVERIYDNKKFYEFIGEVKNLLHKVEFDDHIYKRRKPLKVNFAKFPPSIQVELYNKLSNKVEVFIIIKSSTNRTLYHLLQNYRIGENGYRSNNKFDRYRNLYMAYESLAKNKSYKFTAVRHGISHPSLDNARALRVISKIFKSDKIDIYNYKHRKILLGVHEELLKITERLLISRLWKLTRRPEMKLGAYLII